MSSNKLNRLALFFSIPQFKLSIFIFSLAKLERYPIDLIFIALKQKQSEINKFITWWHW